MVAGKYAKTAGVIRDRFVKTEFSRKIGNRIIDRVCGSRLSISVAAPKIFFEFLEDLL